MDEKEEDLGEEFRKYINIFWKHKFLIFVILTISTSAGVLVYIYEPESYTATASGIIEKETINVGYDINLMPGIRTINSWLRSTFIRQVIEEFDLTRLPIRKSLIKGVFSSGLDALGTTEYLNPSQLASYCTKNIEVSGGGIISVSVTSQYPKVAADMANRFVELIVEKAKEERNQKLQKSIDFLDKQMETVQNIIDEKKHERIALTSSGSDYEKIVFWEEEINKKNKLIDDFYRRYYYEKYKLQFGLLNETERQKRESLIIHYDTSIGSLRAEIYAAKKNLDDVDYEVIEKVRSLGFEIDRNNDFFYSLLDQKQQLVLVNMFSPTIIRFYEMAYAPSTPNKTKALSGIFSLVIFGGMIAAGAAASLEFLDRGFKSSEDVENTIHIKVLGHMPRISKQEEFKLIDPKQHPDLSITEAYRTLGTNVKFAVKGKGIKSIAFTSDKPETGKSLTLVNLSITIAESGNKIMIVDVDLRRPNLHNMLNKSRKPGLTDVLSGNSKLKDVVVKVSKNLYLLPAGSLHYNPESVIESEAMRRLIKGLSEEYDFVFYDSIPLTTFSDVDILASLTDASLLVMEEKKSDKRSMKFAKKRLAEIGTNILGVVINKAEKKFSSYKSYYYYKRYKKSYTDTEDWEKELAQYIKDAISKRAKDSDIKTELLKKGWPKEIVKKKIKELRAQST